MVTCPGRGLARRWLPLRGQQRHRGQTYTFTPSHGLCCPLCRSAICAWPGNSAFPYARILSTCHQADGAATSLHSGTLTPLLLQRWRFYDANSAPSSGHIWNKRVTCLFCICCPLQRSSILYTSDRPDCLIDSCLLDTPSWTDIVVSSWSCDLTKDLWLSNLIPILNVYPKWDQPYGLGMKCVFSITRT